MAMTMIKVSIVRMVMLMMATTMVMMVVMLTMMRVMVMMAKHIIKNTKQRSGMRGPPRKLYSSVLKKETRAPWLRTTPKI
jgi:hypothetical protein